MLIHRFGSGVWHAKRVVGGWGGGRLIPSFTVIYKTFTWPCSPGQRRLGCGEAWL